MTKSPDEPEWTAPTDIGEFSPRDEAEAERMRLQLADMFRCNRARLPDADS